MGFSVKEGIVLIIRWSLKSHLKTLKSQVKSLYSVLLFEVSWHLDTPFFCDIGCFLRKFHPNLISPVAVPFLPPPPPPAPQKPEGWTKARWKEYWVASVESNRVLLPFLFTWPSFQWPSECSLSLNTVGPGASVHHGLVIRQHMSFLIYSYQISSDSQMLKTRLSVEESTHFGAEGTENV